jgi:Tfp pilus assembly protein PilF
LKRYVPAAFGLFLIVSQPAGAQGSVAANLSPSDLEEASAVALHTADGLARGHTNLFAESMDEISLVGAAVGTSFVASLTPRQMRQVEDQVLEAMSGAFAARSRSPAPCRVLEVEAHGAEARVAVLMQLPSGPLKTLWTLKSIHGEWRVEDLVLVDQARSVRSEAIASLGTPPIARWRKRRQEARGALLPRLAGFLGTLVIGVIFVRRTRGRERLVVAVVAAVPCVLFGVDGYLATSRVWSEPVEIRLSDNSQRARVLRQFQAAVSRQNLEGARRQAESAVELGAAREPLDFILGRLAEQQHDAKQASEFYERALSGPRPAPGAWAGLARLALFSENYAESVANWERYLAAAGRDPDSLFLLGVAHGKNRNFAAAQSALRAALAMEPSRPEFYEVSARIAALEGNVEFAISRFHEEERIQPIDRSLIGADPSFSSLADSKVWKEFLAEKRPEVR